MRESRFRKIVLELLRPLAAMAVENGALDGTPDVCCTAGWIELKCASRPVDIDLRKSQRIWLRKWRVHGGKAWTLTYMEGTWMLHDGHWSADNLGADVSRQFLIDVATRWWSTTPSREQLIGALFAPLPKVI